MRKLFDDWSAEIRQYCENNNLSYEKASRLTKCCGTDFLALQFYDPSQGKDGLLDETPMPLVLFIHLCLRGGGWDGKSKRFLHCKGYYRL